MKHYIDSEGNYLGGWDENPPAGAVEVGEVPLDARQKWDGHTWLPLPVEVPVAVSMMQARLAMLNAGLLQQVQEAITAMPGAEGDAARIQWEFAMDVRRDWPLVAALQQMLGLTDAQADALFIAAAAI